MKIKIRIPVAPPSQRHRSIKDYDRRRLKRALRRSLKGEGND